MLALVNASLALLPHSGCGPARSRQRPALRPAALKDRGALHHQRRSEGPTHRFAGDTADRAELEAENPGHRRRLLLRAAVRQGRPDRQPPQLVRALERPCVERAWPFARAPRCWNWMSDLASGCFQRGALIGARWPGAQSGLCARAVLACGAWSASLLPRLPVVPIRARCPLPAGPRPGLRRVLFGPGTYPWFPARTPLIVVGATSEPDAGFAAGSPPGPAAAGGRPHRPVAGGGQLVRDWRPLVGFRRARRDQLPLLGPVPIEGCGWPPPLPQRCAAAAVTAELNQPGEAAIKARDGSKREPTDACVFCRRHARFVGQLPRFDASLFSRKALQGSTALDLIGGRQVAQLGGLEPEADLKISRFQASEPWNHVATVTPPDRRDSCRARPPAALVARSACGPGDHTIAFPDHRQPRDHW